MLNSFFGFSHLGTPGPGHRTRLQLTNQHVMSSRSFMEKNPDAYDYSKAQVPGPLTAEMEARQAIRKRERKAARRHRQEQQWEQGEQRRFAALSN